MHKYNTETIILCLQRYILVKYLQPIRNENILFTGITG